MCSIWMILILVIGTDSSDAKMLNHVFDRVEPNLNHSDLEQKLPASKRQKFQISSTDDDDAPEAIDISSDDNTTPAGGQKPSRPPTTYLNLTSSDSEDV